MILIPVLYNNRPVTCSLVLILQAQSKCEKKSSIGQEKSIVRTFSRKHTKPMARYTIRRTETTFFFAAALTMIDGKGTSKRAHSPK